MPLLTKLSLAPLGEWGLLCVEQRWVHRMECSCKSFWRAEAGEGMVRGRHVFTFHGYLCWWAALSLPLALVPALNESMQALLYGEHFQI